MIRQIGMLGLVCVLGLSACTSTHNDDMIKRADKSYSPKADNAKQSQATQSGAHRVSRVIKLRRFTQIKVEGPFKTEVIAGTSKRQVRLIGSEVDVNNLSVRNENGQLIVGVKPHKQIQDDVLVVIHAGQLSEITHNGDGHFTAIGMTGPLNRLNVNSNGMTSLSGRSLALHELNLNGRGVVKINGVYANNLVINGEGSNPLQLHGRLGLSTVNLSGGQFSAYWIDSRHLHVNASGNAQVQIAGRVKLFEANLKGTAHLNARYLRAHTVFVKTHDSALAELQVTDAQNTLAMDTSNIYFYKKADFHGDFMAKSGAVLNMNGMS